MGQILYPMGGPADAGRALPGFRSTLIPCGDAARPSDPALAALGCRLRARRRCALRLPRQSTVPTTRPRPWPRGPGALLAGGMGRLALAGGIVETVDCLRPWATRPHLGSVRRCTRALPARGHCCADASLRGLQPCLNRVSLATPAASRGKGATRLQMGGGLQVVSGKSARLPRRLRCASPASTHASGQAVTISSPVGSPAAIPLRGTAVSVPPWPAASPLSFLDAPAETPRLCCRFLLYAKAPRPSGGGRWERQNRAEAGRLEDAGSFAGRLCERIGGSTW